MEKEISTKKRALIDVWDKLIVEKMAEEGMDLNVVAAAAVAAKEEEEEELIEKNAKRAKVDEDESKTETEENNNIIAAANSRTAYLWHYQITVELQDGSTNSTINRKVVVSGTVTLDNLHKILQIVMRWHGEDDEYSFVKDGVTYKKGVRGGLSPTKVKFNSVCTLPKSQILYKYNIFTMIITVDGVAKSRPDFWPRCVGGATGAPSEGLTLEKYFTMKPSTFNINDINRKLLGKRFGANSTNNKKPKDGPAFWVPDHTSTGELNQMTLEYMQKPLINNIC